MTSDLKTLELQSYAGYYLNDEMLKASSSGGAATALAEAVIKQGGCVFGVKYTADFKGAEYHIAETVEELEKLKGSKYIETSHAVFYNGEYYNVYLLVGEMLSDGRVVLFTGLGCTIAALYSALDHHNIDISNLYTIELICHGVAPRIIAEQYIDCLEMKYKSKIKTFTVRSKIKGWKPIYLFAEFENGEFFKIPFYRSDYGYAFNLVSRESCYNCRFRGINHKADICLGDYWGITEKEAFYNKNGVSLIIIQSNKGKILLEKIDRKSFFLIETDIANALEKNPFYWKDREKDKKYLEVKKNLSEKGLHNAVVQRQGRLLYLLRKLKTKLLYG